MAASPFNDTLTGNAFANTISGGAGNDVLSGGAEGDWLGQIYRLYGAALGREADTGGLDNWVSQLRAGVLSLDQVAGAFTSSVEFQNTYGSLDDTQFVTLLYSNVLHRSPDPGGLAGWLSLLGSGTPRSDVVVGFSESPEYRSSEKAALEAFIQNVAPGDANVLDGGDGSDTASYALATSGVTVDLGIAGPQETYGAGIDWLQNIENISGSPFNDTLTGNAGANIIAGGAGDDILTGGGGADSLSGHAPGAISPTDFNTFRFIAPSDSAPASFDTISDFVAGLDKIDLTSLVLTGPGPAQLAWLGAQGTDASASLANPALAHGVWTYTPGAGVTYLYADVDGDGKADLKVQLNSSPLAGDFVGVPVNNAPVLDASKTPAGVAVLEDAGAPVGAVGTPVSLLVDFASPSGQVDNVTDVDAGALLGIAVTGADSSNGTWWYSTNGGSSWSALGAVSGGTARLLAADAGTRLYFQGGADYDGQADITFRAWDQTSGISGGTADTTINGGTTAFSTATDTATFDVTPVNDPAVLSSATVNLTEANTSAAISTSGTLTISDVDSPQTFVTQAGTVGSYGTFAINTAGAWSYTASSAHDEFAAGSTHTDTFSVASADGTTTSVTINITGTNDPAVLSSATVNLTEANTSAAISTSGTLTISDVDSPQTFVTQAGTVGSYGTFAINTAGAWSYTASSAHDEFAAGSTHTDTFSVASADGTTTSVTINITGTNDPAVLSSATVNLTEANTSAAISTSGTLTISDVDSPQTFVTQAGTVGSYGTFAINTAGAWSYTASSAHDEFAAGSTHTDTFSVASADGTTTSVTINITGTNDPAVLSSATVNLTEANTSAAISTSGTLTISDVDSPQTFVTQAGTVGSYGTFAINTAGAWSYTASSAHDEFAAGSTHTDTFSVASADGTTTSVTINITGTNDPAVLSSATVNLTEANTSAAISTSGTLTISDVDSPADVRHPGRHGGQLRHVCDQHGGGVELHGELGAR